MPACRLWRSEQAVERVAEGAHPGLTRNLVADGAGGCGKGSVVEQAGEGGSSMVTGITAAREHQARAHARETPTCIELVEAPRHDQRGNAIAQALGGRADAAVVNDRGAAWEDVRIWRERQREGVSSVISIGRDPVWRGADQQGAGAGPADGRDAGAIERREAGGDGWGNGAGGDGDDGAGALQKGGQLRRGRPLCRRIPEAKAGDAHEGRPVRRGRLEGGRT